MWKLDTTNMAHTSDEMNTYNPKGVDSRVPIDMCYRRAWTYQGVGVSKALNIIWEEIMRRRRRNLMRYFCRVLRWILEVRRSVGTSRGVKELEGMYVWLGK